jgi:hypothetical protein
VLLATLLLGNSAPLAVILVDRAATPCRPAVQRLPGHGHRYRHRNVHGVTLRQTVVASTCTGA